MSTRILVEREEVDRMILIGMDVDKRVGELTRALKELVGALGVARQDPALAGQVEGASARAEQVLEAGLPNTKGGQL